MLKKLKSEFAQAKTLLGFTMLQTTGQTAGMAIPLVIAWLFSKEMWGRYSFCEPVIFFFSALLILSAKPPFIVYANQERSKTGSIRKTFSIQCIFLAASVFLFFAVILIGIHPITTFAKITKTELMYVSLAFLAIIMKDFAGNIFMAMNQRIKNAFVELAFGALTLSFIVVFYFLHWIDLKSVFLSYFLASLLILAVSLFTIDFKMLLPLGFDHSHFSEMFNFTLWGMAGAVSSYLINWAGILLLGYYATIEDSGTYNLAYKFFKGFAILIYITSGYFLPHISENIDNPQKINVYLFHKRPRILLLGIICLAIAWVIMPSILNLLYPNKYADAGLVIRILIIGSAAFLYTAMYYPLFVAMKMYKFIQIATVTQVILNIALSLLFIPRYGLSGAAIATVFSYIYLAIVTEGYYRLKLMTVLNKA
jgi:O-antigen/teichoic acid export membrane protein